MKSQGVDHIRSDSEIALITFPIAISTLLLLLPGSFKPI